MKPVELFAITGPKNTRLSDLYPMEDILLPAAYGYEKRTLKISSVMGADRVLHISINNWYQGQIVRVNGEWVVFLNPKSDLCSNDIQVIKDEIEKY